MVNNKEWLVCARKLYKIQQMRRDLEREESMLMDYLKELSHHVPYAYGNYSLVAQERKGSVDYKAIPELASVNTDLYRKPPTIAWKLEHRAVSVKGISNAFLCNDFVKNISL